MKICGNCGASNDDYCACCTACGSPLPASAPKNHPNGGKILKNVLLAVSALAVSAAVIVGAVKLVGGNTSRVSKGAQRTANSFIAKLEESDELSKLIRQAQSLTDGGKYTSVLGYSCDSMDITLTNNYSRSAKQILGTIALDARSLGFQMDLDYSANKNVIQFSHSGLSMNVYGFSMKDFSEKYRNSVLYSFLKMDIPEDLNTLLFSGNYVDRLLRSGSNDVYSTFEKSVNVKKVDTRQITIGGVSQKCTVYYVTWDEQALNKLLKSDSDQVLLGPIKELIRKILPQISSGCTVYVNSKGYLVAADFISLGTEYTLRMEGTNNVWDTFSLEKKSLYSDPVVYRGTAVCDATGLRINLIDGSECLVRFTYDSSSKQYALFTQKLGTILSGHLISSGEAVGLSLEWESDTQGSQSIYWTIAPLTQKPGQLAKKYIDLFDLGLMDWQKILLDFGIRIPF